VCHEYQAEKLKVGILGLLEKYSNDKSHECVDRLKRALGWTGQAAQVGLVMYLPIAALATDVTTRLPVGEQSAQGLCPYTQMGGQLPLVQG
jgi:hypothetical protein